MDGEIGEDLRNSLKQPIEMTSDEQMDGTEGVSEVGGQLRLELAKILGIALDVENGVAAELSTNTEVLRRLRNSVDAIPDGTFFDQGLLQTAFDELIAACFSCVYVDAELLPIEEASVGKFFAYELFDAVLHLPAGFVLKYVFRVFHNCRRFLGQNDIDERSERIGNVLQSRLLSNYLLELRGWSVLGNPQDATVAAFVRAFLVGGEIAPPDGFLPAFIVHVASLLDHTEALKEAFNPVLDCLRYCAGAGPLKEMDMTIRPFNLLELLVSIKYGKDRPICDVLADRPDFCPKVLTVAVGREFARRSFFAPFLNKAVAEVNGGSVDRNAAITRFAAFADISHADETRFMFYNSLNNCVSLIRGKMHRIFHNMLLNGGTREKTMEYLAKMLELNHDKSKLHVSETNNADDGFMLNVCSVLLRLSGPITLDKIHSNYIFHPNCRLKLADETRIKFTSEDVQNYANTLEFKKEDTKFMSECFFFTVQAIRLGLNATLEAFKNVKRTCSDYRSAIREVERQAQSGPENLRRRAQGQLRVYKEVQKKALLSLMAYECMVCDEALLSECVEFAAKQMDFLCRLLNPEFPTISEIPAEAPAVFGMMPEFMLESVLDILGFALKTNSTVLGHVPLTLVTNLLVFLCNANFFNNPFLTAKIVDVVFMMCPSINPPAQHFFYHLIRQPYAQANLFPKLVQFYSDVESTGASSEFYDKFNIRRAIQVIFRELWTDLGYRGSIMEMARACPPEFVRFINMVINDATFLMDESLAGLKKIHEIEVLVENKAEFEKLSAEEQQAKMSALNESSRLVRSWMVLGTETMDLFAFFTEDVPNAFYENALGDRIASMLNYNLLQLCGPKCTELKVKDAKERFYWEPRRTVNQIIKIYLNMSSEKFADCIVNDERSYSPDAFKSVFDRLQRLLPAHDFERFRNLFDAVEALYKAKADQEEDFGDDVPDHFKDAIMATLMTDSVKLPSGHFMDRKNILRHLLSTKNDPFTRAPLTENELIDATDLKQEIQQWIRERKQNRA